MDQNKSSLNELKELRDELKLKHCEENNTKGHKYGLWSKKLNEDGTISYMRTCKKCGEERIITTSTFDLGIESEIKKQKEYEKYTDYFCNSSIDDLTDENILFFLAVTESKQSYMDMNKIVDKIVSIGKAYEFHNDKTQEFIYNTLLYLQQSGYIPYELFDSILGYLIQVELNKNNEFDRKARAV